MQLLLPLNALVPSLWWGAFTLIFVMVGLLFYGYLADRVIFEAKGRVQASGFGRADVVLAAGLTGLFLLLIGTHQNSDAVPTPADMILGVVVSTGVFSLFVAGIIGSLWARHLTCRETFGFDRANFGVVVCAAALLLLMAYPLIDGALRVNRWVLMLMGYGEEAPQEIVRFLAVPGHGAVRAVVAISALIFAPVQEEIVFRGYLYGVIRRYAGIEVGVVVNAALFAGIHLHPASFGGLFVLAVCLTLAYEWTGSILVPMTVHALFNSLTIFSLLSGNGNG